MHKFEITVLRTVVQQTTIEVDALDDLGAIDLVEDYKDGWDDELDWVITEISEGPIINVEKVDV